LSIHVQRSPCAGQPAHLIRRVLFPTAEFSLFPQERLMRSPVVPPPAWMARRVGMLERNVARKLAPPNEDGVDSRWRCGRWHCRQRSNRRASCTLPMQYKGLLIAVRTVARHV